jgi:hypothetical protein
MKNFIFLVCFALLNEPLQANPKICAQLIRSFLDLSPKELPAAVAHIHSYKLNPQDAGMTVSVLVPTPTQVHKGIMRDLAAQNPHKTWPDKFVISDGYPNGHFISVDMSEGSPLKLQIQKIINKIKRKESIDPATDPEKFIQHLANKGRAYFSDMQNEDSLSVAGKNIYKSPKNFQLTESSKKIFSDFQSHVISADTFITGQNKELVPFEYFFTQPSCTMCIHNALLSSLILREARIPHKFRTGFGSFSGPSYSNTGHSFIELEDGRILDPTWNFLKKQKQHPQYPEWIEGAGWWWTSNTHFPYLELF